MDNFEIGKTYHPAGMALEPPEPFMPTDNSAPHQSNTISTTPNVTQTSGKKEEEEKEEKGEQQPKAKNQKRKQKRKENQEKLLQAVAELAALKASNEVTITERDTLKKDLETSNKLHETYKVRAVTKFLKKCHDIKKLKAEIKALTAAAAEEDDIINELIKKLVVESVKREEDLKALKALDASPLEDAKEMVAKIEVMTATATEEGAETEQPTAAAAKAQGENSTLKKELEDLKKELSESKKSEENFNTVKGMMMKRIKAKNAELTAAVNEAKWQEENTERLKKELGESEKHKQSLRIDKKSLLEAVEKMEAKIEAMTAAMTEAEAEIKEPTAPVTEANAELKKLIDAMAEADAKIEEETAAAAEADAEIEKQTAAAAEAGGLEDNDNNARKGYSLGAAMTDAIRLRNGDLARRY
jgi:hypothetical protein